MRRHILYASVLKLPNSFFTNITLVNYFIYSCHLKETPGKFTYSNSYHYHKKKQSLRCSFCRDETDSKAKSDETRHFSEIRRILKVRSRQI